MRPTANSAIRGTIRAVELEAQRDERKNVLAIKAQINEDTEPMRTEASSKHMFSAKRHTVGGAHFGSGQINLLPSDRFSSQRMMDELAVQTARKPIRLLNNSDMAKTLHTLTSPHPGKFTDRIDRRIMANKDLTSIIKKKPVPLKKVATVTQKPSTNFFRASSIGAMYRDPVTSKSITKEDPETTDEAPDMRSLPPVRNQV